MPIRGGATLFLPPDLKPLWTSNPFYGGPELVDEDAELTALELAYDQQVRIFTHRHLFSFFYWPDARTRFAAARIKFLCVPVHSQLLMMRNHNADTTMRVATAILSSPAVTRADAPSAIATSA